MNQYWKFDIEKFLRDSRKWERKIRKLEKDKDAVRDLKELSTDTPVQTSNVSDPTGQSAAQVIDTLDKQISELKKMIDALDKGRRELTERENDCIDTFFFSSGLQGYNVDMFSHRWSVSIAEVYRIRRQALNTLSDSIVARL